MASPSVIPAADEPVPGEDAKVDGTLSVETRFGTIEFDQDRIITFKQGMLGFPAHLDFAIADLPGETYGEFKLLQSVTDGELSFPVLPLDYLPGLIKEEDIKEALQIAGIPVEDAIVLLIATARKNADGVQLSVNLRAPVLLNAKLLIGRQQVLGNSEYPIRHIL